MIPPLNSAPAILLATAMGLGVLGLAVEGTKETKRMIGRILCQK